MGDTLKGAGNVVSSVMTGGALSTNGKGWAQGGSLKDVMNNYTGGMIPGLNGSNKVNVPDATQPGVWNLSGADGKLRSDLLLNGQQPAAFNQSQGILDKLQSQATSEGPTQSAQYLMDQNKRNLANNLSAADQGAAQERSSAISNLAMRGGADAGAMERIGKSSMVNNMLNKQRLRNDAAGSDLEVLAKDEAQKLQTMQALPSQLLAQAGFEQGGKQFDISNTLNTMGNKYNQDMAAWAANQTAREQAQLANKPSGLLGLGFMGL